MPEVALRERVGWESGIELMRLEATIGRIGESGSVSIGNQGPSGTCKPRLLVASERGVQHPASRGAVARWLPD